MLPGYFLILNKQITSIYYRCEVIYVMEEIRYG